MVWPQGGEHPLLLPPRSSIGGVPPELYHNRGDGSFEEVAQAAGVASRAGKGLGVVVSDLDDDGKPDIFGANDSTINYLWHNLGNGKFEDASLRSGAGFNDDGSVQACMGIDAGDYDQDGRFDLFTTNLDLEYNTLYHNNGRLIFSDVSYRAGVAVPHLTLVGFGTGFLDYDLDGWLDIFVANGHIIDNIAQTNDSLSYAQPKSLFHNLGNGKFEQLAESMPDLMLASVNRGVAFGDIDGDGDIDLLVGSNNREAQLYRYDSTRHGAFLVVQLSGRQSNREALARSSTCARER